MFGHRKGSEWFRHFSGVPGGYRNPPGEVIGLMGHKKEAHQPTRGWCAPFGQEAELDKVWVGAAPLSFSPTPPSLPLLLQLGKGGILLPMGVGLLQGAP